MEKLNRKLKKYNVQMSLITSNREMQVLWCEMVKIFCICPCGSKAEPDVRGGL